MNILEFCERKNIKCLPIKMKIKDGKKIYLDFTHYGDESKFNDGHSNFNILDFKKLTLIECQAFCKKYKSQTEWIGIDCSETQQLDIDDKTGVYWNSALANKFGGLPYFLSVTKQMPHYFMNTKWTSGKQNKNIMKFEDGTPCDHDILYNNAWSYAKRDAIVQNYEKDTTFKEWDTEPKPKTKVVLTSNADSCETTTDYESNTEEEIKIKVQISKISKFHEEIVKLIDPKYIDEYDSWTNIMWAMRNEGYSEKFARQMSKKSDKYDSEKFTKFWYNETHKGDTIVSQGTLNYYAKLSNVKAYNLLYIIEKMEKMTCLDECMLKDYFLHAYGDNIIAIKSKKELYVYSDNKWLEDEGGSIIQNELLKSIKNLYVIMMEKASEAVKQNPDDEASSKHQSVIAKLNYTYGNKHNKNIYALVFNHFKSNAEEQDLFDNNRYVFSFTNKSYNLETNKWFVPTKMDYILTTCGKQWIEPTNEKREFIKDLVSGILPNEDIRKAYTSILRSGLTGIRHEYFIIATGKGRNGKGVINELMAYLLGEYMGTLHLSLLTKEIKSGANTELRSLHKKRFIIASEPEEGNVEKLRCSNVKALTGNETHKARGLYEKDDVTKIMGTFIMECNTKPEIAGKKDTAILDRMLIIPFDVTFTNDLEKIASAPNDYKLKNELYKEETFKVDNYCALFEYLITEYNKNDLYIPKECKKLGADYLLDKDDFANWFLDVYEEAPANELISIKELHATYLSKNMLTMTKAHLREMTCKKFIAMVKEHMLLKQHFIDTNQYYMKTKITKQSIWGWRMMSNDSDSDDAPDDE